MTIEIHEPIIEALINLTNELLGLQRKRKQTKSQKNRIALFEHSIDLAIESDRRMTELKSKMLAIGNGDINLLPEYAEYKKIYDWARDGIRDTIDFIEVEHETDEAIAKRKATIQQKKLEAAQ